MTFECHKADKCQMFLSSLLPLHSLQQSFNLWWAYESFYFLPLQTPGVWQVFPGGKTSTTQGVVCFVRNKQKRNGLVRTPWFNRQRENSREKTTEYWAVWMTGELRSPEQKYCNNQRLQQKMETKTKNVRVRLLLLLLFFKYISTYM